jgi:hypothetical protein
LEREDGSGVLSEGLILDWMHRGLIRGKRIQMGVNMGERRGWESVQVLCCCLLGINIGVENVLRAATT